MIVTQQVMFRDRKYLHVKLIGLRVCWPAEAAIISAFWNRIEIAPDRSPLLSSYSWLYGYRSTCEITRKGTSRVFQVQTKLRKIACGRGQRKEKRKRRSFAGCSYPVQRVRNTVCGMDYISAKSNKLISRSNSAAATTTRATTTPRTRALSRELSSQPARARIFTGCCTCTRTYTYTRSISRTNGLKKCAGTLHALPLLHWILSPRLGLKWSTVQTHTSILSGTPRDLRLNVILIQAAGHDDFWYCEWM